MRVGGQIAVVAVGLIVLAGCADRQEGNDTLPTASTSAETSASLEPLGPADLPMPAEAREQTPEGAKAFIEYYMDIYNLAQASTDSTYLREFSSGCETCDRVSDDIDADSQQGYKYDGGQVSVDGIGQPGVSGGQAQAAFAITQAALSITDEIGEPVEGLSFPERISPSCGAVLTWSEQTVNWQFTQWDVS